ncbi:MAG: site-2 protease family protein [bacterium]
METQLLFFQIIVFIFSVVIHEYMHGWMANYLGDPTAKDAGRLTINPIPHIDLWGSIILPLMLAITKTPFVFGYAKPVPFNPYNLRDQKYGSAKVALAGPLSNFIVALFFGLLLRFFSGYLIESNIMLVGLLQIIVYLNLFLMVLNLLPIPPLDGSKVLMPFLPYDWQVKFSQLERFGFAFVLLFVFFGFSLIIPIINFLFKMITGI